GLGSAEQNHRQARRSLLATRPDRHGSLDIETDVEDVAFLDDVLLALEALQAALADLGARAGLDQVAPADHLAADEATRDVGMDLARRVERRAAAAKRPRARLGRPDREERDQPERFLEPSGHVLERRRAVAKSGSLVDGQLREFGLELQVDPAGPVLDRDRRLRGQRLERVRDLAAVAGDRPSLLHVREQRLEARDLLLQLRLA